MDPTTVAEVAPQIDINTMLENGMVVLVSLIILIPTVWFVIGRATRGQARTTETIVGALIDKLKENPSNLAKATALDVEDIRACGAACTAVVLAQGELTRAALRNDEIAVALNRQTNVQERQIEVISLLRAEIGSLPQRTAVVVGGALRDRKYALRLASTSEYSSDPEEAEEAKKALERMERREREKAKRRMLAARIGGRATSPTPLYDDAGEEFSDMDRILDVDNRD
jgi:hypothetical protein